MVSPCTIPPNMSLFLLFSFCKILLRVGSSFVLTEVSKFDPEVFLPIGRPPPIWHSEVGFHFLLPSMSPWAPYIGWFPYDIRISFLMWLPFFFILYLIPAPFFSALISFLNRPCRRSIRSGFPEKVSGSFPLLSFFSATRDPCGSWRSWTPTGWLAVLFPHQVTTFRFPFYFLCLFSRPVVRVL